MGTGLRGAYACSPFVALAVTLPRPSMSSIAVMVFVFTNDIMLF